MARNQRPPSPRTPSTTKRKDGKRENDADELEQLGKYRIVEVLGKGAMGIVYKGFDPQIERHVAIKTIRKELVEEEVAEQTIKRFKNEAQAAGRLTHPGIVGIYEYGEDDSTAYIAMEFVQGRGLREFLSHHERFSLHDAVSIMGQLLEAIDYAHEQGIVHRDIKPANIIMMANGKLKVADFGIARISNSNLTTVGSVMGTPSYMSPEQFAGSNVDRRADLFSCGVVFYELLTGSKPFTGATETIAYKICHEPHSDPSTVDPKHVPAIFDRVIAKALAKKPEMRFQNAREFADAIIKAYDKRARNEEETVLNSPGPDLASSGRVETTFPPPGWKVEELKPLEELLIPYVGPMARIMVKKTAAKTVEVQQLISQLASNIEEEADRAKFLSEAMAKSPGITSPGTAPDATRTSETTRFGKSILEQKTIDHAAERLAHYLGPIAKLLAKKAAAGAGSRTALYLALAENIPAAEDKKAFLKDAGIK